MDDNQTPTGTPIPPVTPLPQDPTPQPTPIPDPTPQPSFAPQPNQPNGFTDRIHSLQTTGTVPGITSTPQKSKKRLIISSIIGTLLLAGIGSGIFWFINYQKPENVVMHALQKAISHRAVRLTGDLTYTYTPTASTTSTDSSIYPKSISITSNSETSILPTSAEATIQVAMSDDTIIEVKASEIFLADGILYFKLDGLESAITGSLPEEASAYLDVITELLQEVDGTWWRYDISDFDPDPRVIDLYDCALDAASSLNDTDTKNEFIDLYRNHPILDVTKSDTAKDTYIVTGNTINAAGFLNNLKHTHFYQDLSTCMSQAYEGFEDYDDINPDDFTSSTDDTPTVALRIHPWSHQLESIHLSYEDEQNTFTGTITLEFLDSIDVSAPDDSRSVQDLTDMISEAYTDIYEIATTPDYSLSSTRDTQRTDDLARLTTAVTNYQKVNRGRLPDQADWDNFISRYILVAGDTFDDPSSAAPYQFVFDTPSSSSGTISVIYGASCDGNQAVAKQNAPRQLALTTTLESGEQICLNN